VSDPDRLVEMSGIAKGYGSPGAGRLEVLRRIDLEVRRGESVAVTGPSGSGKSTLLAILGTLVRPDAGRLFLEGEDLLGMGETSLSRVRNRRIGFVFQFHHLLPQCSVLENVLVPTLPSPSAESRSRALRLLDRVGLSGRLAHRPGQLSGGERQRVAVVRALINGPSLLLADEPTGSIEPAGAENLASLLQELNREEGTALVVATHSARLAERMGRVLALRDGVLIPPDPR
jgi:lipoprotein-releasing system ATP-binding protein